MHFEEALKFRGDSAEVWRRASSITEIPNYWHGTRSLVVIGESGGVKRARIKFAFGGSGEAEISTDEWSRTLTIDYRSGPFTGRQTVTVNEGEVLAMWDFKFRGLYLVASKWNEGHFRTGTVHALERLVDGYRRKEEQASTQRPKE
jgi:hypothetical protein